MPTVALLGPRQVGKTTLAHAIAKGRKSVYVDLESHLDLEKLTDAAFYLSGHEDDLVVLDEVQRVPELFATLRGLIDQSRRQGKKSGRFLLLGSASADLLRQSETLAGRIAYIELSPFYVLEVGADLRRRLWVRGGLPVGAFSGQHHRQASGQIAEGVCSRQRDRARAFEHRRPRGAAWPSRVGRQLGGLRHREPDCGGSPADGSAVLPHRRGARKWTCYWKSRNTASGPSKSSADSRRGPGKGSSSPATISSRRGGS
jgi:hypothetical protein